MDRKGSMRRLLFLVFIQCFFVFLPDRVIIWWDHCVRVCVYLCQFSIRNSLKECRPVWSYAFTGFCGWFLRRMWYRKCLTSWLLGNRGIKKSPGQDMSLKDSIFVTYFLHPRLKPLKFLSPPQIVRPVGRPRACKRTFPMQAIKAQIPGVVVFGKC